MPMPNGQRAAVARRLGAEAGGIRACRLPAVRRPDHRGPRAGSASRDDREGAARRGPAQPVPPWRRARLDRPVPEPLGARQDRRPGRARQRGAACAVRGPVAADVLAHRRRARAPGARAAPPALAPLIMAAATRPLGKPLVLVPGACLGGWAWRDVAALTRRLGHDTY